MLERAARNDMDMNCNTCLLLERVRHDKDPLGFLYGKCPSTEEKLYPRNDGLTKFHPNDWMGMSCYTNRDTGKPSELSS